MSEWARGFGEYVVLIAGGVGVALIAALIVLALSRVTLPALRHLWSRASPLGRLFGALLFLICSINATTKAPARNAPKRVAASVASQVVYSSDKTDRVLTVDDFARGFVQTRIGTNETFDFTAPAKAEICSDWKSFGAAEDWFYLSLSDWSFPVGTNNVSRLRVHSNGRVDLQGGGKLLPLAANLGLTPKTSQFWHCLTPSNTLQLTWQNVLYNRTAETPISIQAELCPNGTFTYRYDFSSVNSETLTNILVGAAFSGKQAGITNVLPVSTTSISYYPLAPEDAENPDRDEDGIPLIDELFVYGTDPSAADTDFDGLSDYDEIFVYETDPLNPHSLSAALCDGFAVKLNGEDPFSCPQGSTNTVLEHLFYTGTTNGYITLPSSSDTMAVLRVAVSGIGSGELIVGSKVVLLLGQTAAPKKAASRVKAQSNDASDTPELLVQLAKGITYPLYLRADSSLSISLSSSDFAFGVLPSLADGRFTGSIHFPNTRATTPCIHSFYAQSTLVSLPVTDDAKELTCTWQESKKVKVENQPPRAALLTGKFSPKQTAPVSYTLAHPKYLFGETTYTQTARYCPQPKEDEDEDKPWYNPSVGEGGGDGSAEEDSELTCCRLNECSVFSPCKCGDCCVEVEVEPYDQSFDTACPEHAVPYEECAYLHEEAYTNATHSVTAVQDILYIRDPLAFKEIPLTVPAIHQYCCPCPSHVTNYVAASYTSSRLRLLDEEGAPFEDTTKSCTVRVAGISPSSAIGDAALSFSSNGKTDKEYKFTVLGLAIKHPSLDLAALNTLAPNFGLPLTVSTNLSTAAQLRLVTNIGLPTGNIHLSFGNTTGTFTAWYRDSATGEYRKLLDSATQPTKNLSLSQWRALTMSARGSTTAALPIYITSSQAGSTRILFRYWDSTNGFLQDEVRQTLTSVLPCIQADINHDGKIDETDVLLQAKGNPFRFWCNEDTEKGDYAGQIADTSPNASDLKVNGKADLLNFFPIKIDLGSLYKVFGSAAKFTLKDTANCMHYCVLKDFSSYNLFDLASSSVYTQEGTLLENAALSNFGSDGIDLNNLSGDGSEPHMLALEAAGFVYPDEGLTLVVTLGGQEIYREQLKVRILSIDWLFRNVSLRGAEENSAFVPYISEMPSNRPDNETDGEHIIFVPGYNVNEEGSQQWGRAIFKRLWWAGFRGMFTVVDWCGDYSQTTIPLYGEVSPDYYANVKNAFLSAGAFANVANNLPGQKVVLAHSLGNMMVSSAIKDNNLNYKKYFMLNAAVPMEAYDERIMNDLMIDGAWSSLPERFRTAHFADLFIGNQTDFRFGLSWKGRFAGIENLINCYSETEDVLANPVRQKVFGIEMDDFGGVWSKQELFKGCAIWYGVNTISYSGIRIEGGWGINARYVVNPLAYIPLVGFNESYFTNYTREELVSYPLFTSFNDARMTATNSLEIVDDALLAKMLGDAIPAESFAAGSNRIPSLSKNYDLQSFAHEEWPRTKGNGKAWYHSDIKNVAYYFLAEFFKEVVKESNK